MDAKQAVKQIRVLLGMEKAEEVAVVETKIELATGKLKDGTDITYDKLEVDGVVTIGDGPAPEGDYELEDGTVVSVGADGIITAVKPVEAAAVEPEPEAKPEETGTKIEDKVVELEGRIAQLEELLLGFSTQMKTMKDDFSSKIKEIADAPASETVTKKTETPPESATIADKVDFLRKHINK